jgi:hypothetical protein
MLGNSFLNFMSCFMESVVHSNEDAVKVNAILFALLFESLSFFMGIVTWLLKQHYGLLEMLQHLNSSVVSVGSWHSRIIENQRVLSSKSLFEFVHRFQSCHWLRGVLLSEAKWIAVEPTHAANNLGISGETNWFNESVKVDSCSTSQCDPVESVWLRSQNYVFNEFAIIVEAVVTDFSHSKHFQPKLKGRRSLALRNRIHLDERVGGGFESTGPHI